MCSWREHWVLAALVLAALELAALVLAGAAHAQPTLYPGIGRAATAAELAAWDIDVRPDFKGLPPGSGSVAKGQDVWEAKCASCHGVFGESNEVFSPIAGGTSKQDLNTGRVASLSDRSFPGRTTLMKVSTVSTLWDYIRRAMPWTAPKSLSTDEVYAVTAYVLNLGGVVPDDFTLSDRNIADVQQRLPNRNGVSTDHGLWPGASLGNRKPDVQARACMKDCVTEPKVVSLLPDFARNAHGNLAQQNRAVGAQLGADTARAAPTASPGVAAVRPTLPSPASESSPVKATGDSAAAALALTRKHNCSACHGLENRIVGPSFREVAAKYLGRPDAATYLASKILSGGSGIWGSIPMPAQALNASDAGALARWLAEGASK